MPVKTTIGSKEKIWLSSPHLGDNEQTFVNEAFATNWIAPLGPHVNGFEQDISNYLGMGHTAALSSGTAAIHLALVLLEVGRGDVVITQSMTFAGTANPIVYQGATPVFLDSEEETWNMDPNALEDALKQYAANGQRPKAIIPVHLYGMPAKMEEIRALADQYGVPVVEDAAEALGSSRNGVKCGAWGDLNILSFNGNKIITTGGGGALVSNDEHLISKARFLASQARDPAPHYQHSQIGYNYRLSNVLAGIGRGQMQVLEDRVARRRKNFQRYVEYFQRWNDRGYQIEWAAEAEGAFSNRWLSAILIDPAKNGGLTRESLRLAFESAHIDARPLWKPMHLQPVFQDQPYVGGDTCDKLFEHGLCLPSGSNLEAADFERIFGVLDQWFGDTAKLA